MAFRISEMVGCDFPLFAFSHCRDVVAAVSRAGGFGVLGASSFSPEQLELELAWTDDHVGAKPYGVDVLIRENQPVGRELGRGLDRRRAAGGLGGAVIQGRVRRGARGHDRDGGLGL